MNKIIDRRPHSFDKISDKDLALALAATEADEHDCTECDGLLARDGLSCTECGWHFESTFEEDNSAEDIVAELRSAAAVEALI